MLLKCHTDAPNHLLLRSKLPLCIKGLRTIIEDRGILYAGLFYNKILYRTYNNEFNFWPKEYKPRSKIKQVVK